MERHIIPAIGGSSPLARGLLFYITCDSEREGIIPARAGFTRSRRSMRTTASDHPRSRGVYISSKSSGLIIAGSSPLARGLLSGGAVDGGADGIIPARAGFTASPALPRVGLPDHPRSRGVYSHFFIAYPTHPGIIPARAGFTGLRTSSRTPPTDHPRSRGVYLQPGWSHRGFEGSSPLARGLPFGSALRQRPEPGSSPLARGLLAQVVGQFRHGRIIPARAGFTDHQPGLVQHGRDHPRSRGVYPAAPDRTRPAPGSSPLARGLRRSGRGGGGDRRIIPARAGFTSTSPAGRTTRTDHPRSRGVYPRVASGIESAPGSSPLARGLRPRDVRRALRGGIIPARAGFTSRGNHTGASYVDHPRSRGVYYPIFHTSARVCGSSPLARGLPDAAGHRQNDGRIIPARAGFTRARDSTIGESWDHPRSRGVYGLLLLAVDAPVGSSPLARGLLSWSSSSPRKVWIIPARAGFTKRGQQQYEPHWDHPRSRGVYRAYDKHHGRTPGSSPLARGLPPPTHRPGDCRRIIPARAGFTGGTRCMPNCIRDHPRSRGVYARGDHLCVVTRWIIPARAGFTRCGSGR